MDRRMEDQHHGMRNTDRYRRKFGIDGDPKRAEKALTYALEIRKFEIDLYWKRATYFWALIAVSFAAYVSILSSDGLSTDDRDVYSFLACVAGTVFTFTWFLANKGSKFWQENWENHVDMLEDVVIGPLYKTVLHRPEESWPRDLRGIAMTLKQQVTGPEKFSVSSLNAWASMFTLLLWLMLTFRCAAIDLDQPVNGYKITMAILGSSTCVLMYCLGKTHTGAFHHKMRTRRTRIL